MILRSYVTIDGLTLQISCRTLTLILFLKFYVYNEMNKPQSQDHSSIGFSISTEYRIFIVGLPVTVHVRKLYSNML